MVYHLFPFRLDLFSDVIDILNYIATNNKMMSENWMGKDV